MNIIQNILRHFGYELSEINRKESNAFVIQQELMKKKNPIIFDVGADVGSVTKEYRKLFPEASIHCFEPFSESFQQLSRHTNADNNIFCHQLALSEHDGSATLNANLSSVTSSLLPTDPAGSFYWGEGLLDTKYTIEVATISLDSFIEAKNIKHVDILKLDVQGAEFSVFSGAIKTLLNQRVSIIYTELIMCSTYKGQRKLHEYLTLLDSYGYELVDLFNPIKKHRQLIQADLIFMSSTFKQEAKNFLLGC